MSVRVRMPVVLMVPVLMPVFVVAVLVRMVIVLVGVSMVRLRRALDHTTGQPDIDLHGLQPAPVHPVDLHRHIATAKPRRQSGEPRGRGTGRDKRAEQHVAADTRGRIDDGKTAV
jgi:hypothetical protein